MQRRSDSCETSGRFDAWPDPRPQFRCPLYLTHRRLPPLTPNAPRTFTKPQRYGRGVARPTVVRFTLLTSGMRCGSWVTSAPA